VFFVCAVSAFAASPPDSALLRGKAALAQLPLRFEANQGQYDAAVRYAARAAGYRVYLKDSGPELALGSERIAIRLLDANPAAPIQPLNAMDVRTNYMLGDRSRWHTGVANYSRVRYQDVYRGIDVVYYGSENRLEYDFLLEAGADPSLIRMRFDGARNLSVTPAGEVAFDTAGGRLEQKLPAIYQQDAKGARRTVQGRYVLVARNTVGVKVEGYDRRRKLVIDPTLVYTTYIGGGSSDQINAARLDAQGLLYLCGTTDTSDLQPVGNAYLDSLQGVTSIIVAIFDTTSAPSYNLVYLTYLGGTNIDIALAMQVDGQGDIFLTGTTTSTDFPLAGNSVQTTGAATDTAAFVAELNFPNGTLVYSTFLGGTQGNTSGNGIDIDQNGNIYVIGTTLASDFPVTASAYAGVIYGPSDAFLSEININNPNLVYSTFLGGSLEDDGRSIAVTPAGLVYFGASTVSPDFPLAGYSYQDYLNGGEDMIIGVMDMTQSGTDSLVYCTYFGGSNNEELRQVRFDNNGNLMVTGYTLSTDYPVTGNAVQATYGGGGDAVISVVNPLGSPFLVYSTYLGGSDGEVAYDIGTDPIGNIYVTGYTMSSDFPVSADAYQPAWYEGIEIFVSEIQPGTPGPAGLLYSTYLGGASVYQGSAMTVGPDGRFYVSGWAGTGLPMIGNSYQGFFGGGYSDGFLLIFQPDTPLPQTNTHEKRPIVRR
jgi:hypothetical protein